MPMADQPRLPPGLPTLDTGGQCRTCGCLNFSPTEDECSNCLRARQAASDAGAADAHESVRRHPFLPTARRPPPSSAASNGTTRPTPWSATTVNDPARAKENTGQAARVGATCAPVTNGLARADANARASGGNAAMTAMRDARGAGNEQQSVKAEAGAAKIGRPGSSLLSSSGSNSSAAASAANHPDPTPAPASAPGAADVSSAAPASTTNTNTTHSNSGDKRPRKSREVIDLISSDEESEDHKRRAAKRARQDARMRKSNARLTLRGEDLEQDEDVAMVAPGSDEAQRIRPEPPLARSFDSIDFDESDFPSTVDVANMLRERAHALAGAKSTTSSTVSTPTAMSSAPPPPAQEPPPPPLAPTKPTTTPVTTATVARTTTQTTAPTNVPSASSVVSPSQHAGVSDVVQNGNASEKPTQVQETSTSATADVAVEHSQSTPTPDASASVTASRPKSQSETPSTTEMSQQASRSAVETAAPKSSDRKTSAKASIAAPVLHPAAPLQPSKTSPVAPLPVTSVQATPAVTPSQPELSQVVPAPAPKTTTHPVASDETPTTLPASKPVSPPKGTSSVDASSASLKELIVLDDSDDESDEDQGDESGPALFQSRRFQSIVFSARDFMTANEGLNLARRSSTVTQLPASLMATEAVVTSTTLPMSARDSANEVPSTTEPAHGLPPSVSAAAHQANVLQARRKHPAVDSAPSALRAEASTNLPASIKIEQPSPSHSATVRRIIKPTLGHCSTDFLDFMRDSVDGDDEDEDELAMAKLLEVVDLTNLSDESGDDEDDDEDYFEILEVAGPPSDVPSTTNGGLGANDSSGAVKESEVPIKDGQVPCGPAEIKRKRAPRPKETCAICEEKAWIRALVHCPDCKKYYHKRCAREYGDENVCYICDADGMIDDSELTDEHKNELLSLLGAFRQSPEIEQGDDEDEDDVEDKNDTEVVVDRAALLETVATTKSTQRWKEFLTVSTAHVEDSFNRVTSQISQELQDEERKRKYTRGFVRKEEFEKEMTEVLDHYAGLQDREERRLREDRSRAPPAEAPPTDTPVPGAVVNPLAEESAAERPVLAQVAQDYAPSIGPK